MLNNRYRKNTEKLVEGFSLQITPSGVVYNCTNRGMVKIDSLWLSKTGKLAVSLPNGREVQLTATKDGLKTEEELKVIK